MINVTTDLIYDKKSNPKRVIFIQSEEADFTILQNAASGTAKCGLELFNYLNSFEDYSCDYACIGIESDNTDDSVFRQKYDIVVFNHIFHPSIVEVHYQTLQEYNPDIKSIFIVHCLTFHHLGNLLEKIVFNIFDKYICVGPKSYSVCLGKTNNENKIRMIYNPINVDKYENLEFKDKDNQILISYHPFKGNVSNFANDVFPLVKKAIPDAKLKICFPEYWEDKSKQVVDSINQTDGVEILGSLSKDELIAEMMNSKICFTQPRLPENMPYSVIEASLCYCFITNEFLMDGSKDVVSEYYKIQFKAPRVHSVDTHADWIIDKLNNYEMYKNSLIYERNYVMNKFRKENLLPIWKDEFDHI